MGFLELKLLSNKLTRKMKHTKLIGVVAVVLMIVFLSQKVTGGSGPLAIATAGPFAATHGTMHEGTYRIAIVADLDKQSKQEGKKLSFVSYLKEGILKKVSNDEWTVEWQPESDKQLIGQHNEAGRGMELSELEPETQASDEKATQWAQWTLRDLSG
eukprot:gene11584-17845_t